MPVLLVTVASCCYLTPASAQQGWRASAFANMSNKERFNYVHAYPFWKIEDGGTISVVLQQMQAIAKSKNDIRTQLAIQFYYCLTSGNVGVKLPGGKNSHQLVEEMEIAARKNNYRIEETVAHFYIVQDGNTADKLGYEKKYTALQEIFEHMQTIGFDMFKDYYLESIMLNMAMFMWNVEDYEKAFNYLSVAEHYITQTEEGAATYTQVLSYLQSYWKIKQDYNQSLNYAIKLKNFHERFTSSRPMQQWWTRFWKGFSTIEIADLLIKQGRIAESEQYADSGYLLCRVPNDPVNEIVSYQAEFDALMVLIDAKILLGKLQEADTLLQRGMQINELLQAKGQLDYFKPLRLYRYIAQYNEQKGRDAIALSYIHKADKLQDSLNKRNDAHKMAMAQQRFDAEKFSQKIAAIEQEKKLEKMLRNSAIIILALTLTLGFMYARGIKNDKRQKEQELADAKISLEAITQGLKDKSELADNLRDENEKLSAQGRRSEYLEQLSSATILTDKDWAHFKAMFEKVYPDFILLQKTRYPNITPAEVRLMVLEKLGLNTQEMANMLGVNKNTINQTRLRLRKKMEAETN